MIEVRLFDLEPDSFERFTYRGTLFTGKAYEYGSHGNVVAEIMIRDGMQNGVSREYYDSGVTKCQEVFRNGVLHGEAREWYESGRTKTVGSYEYGICTALREYDEEGALVRDYKLTEGDAQYDLLELYRRSEPPSRWEDDEYAP
jgi:antitoxin component YwqK of YwqJK toxin-antitoxin module